MATAPAMLGIGIIEPIMPLYAKSMGATGVMLGMWSRGFYRWGFNSFFPIYATKFADFSKTQVGLALFFYMLAGGILQYPSGVAADKYISKRSFFVLTGGILSALIMFIMPSQKSILLIILMTLGMGIFSAFSRASAVAILTEKGRIHGMGKTNGIFTTSISLGQVMGAFFFGIMVDYFNLPYAFYLGGIVGICGTALSFLFLMDKPYNIKQNP